MTEGQSAAIALILVGVAMSRDGDGARVTKQLVPELLTGGGAMTMLKAIQEQNRSLMKSALSHIGVELQGRELAVDAVMRTHLQAARQKAQEQLAQLDAAWEAETARAIERNKFDTTATEELKNREVA